MSSPKIIASIRESFTELQIAREALPDGEDPPSRLRAGVAQYIEYVDAHRGGYLGVLRGELGADPDVQAVVDEQRHEAAHHILQGFGAPDPPPPALRAAVHAWIGYLDELMLDHLTYGDVSTETLIDLASTTLLAALGAASVAGP